MMLDEKDDIIPIMDYIKVDILNANQLMVDDLIMVDGEVVSIVSIESLADGYIVEIVNDFGERDTIQTGEYDKFDLMMLQ